ncbi:kelch-like protein 24a [Branchiostoma lanceolatum]|uniref:kelch-like protein 24a n=1 Tax=Branchiostoma lanceolatum TaxID=7740 RepID=UPI003453A0EE
MAAAEQIPRSYKDCDFRVGFFDTIGDLQKAGILQDVVIEVEGRQFPCHRLVLSAASPYFRAMFTSDMAESRQKTVVLQGLDAVMWEEILSYIYTGTLHVSLDKVQPLYQAADLLQLDYVRDTCSSYMAMSVESSTCVGLYKFADVYSVDVVLNRSLPCICRRFAEVAFTEEFYSLSVNQLTEIISHDELDVKEETTVWEAVVRWVQHSREDRLHHLPSILLHIRFNLLTSDDTAAILEHPLIRENPGTSEVRNLVLRGTSNQKRRVGMDAQEMVLLFRTVETTPNTTEMHCMDPGSGYYIKYSYNLPTVMAATVTSENDIYILVEESYDQLSLLQYNHMENAWVQKSSIDRNRKEEPFAIDKSFVYLLEVDGHFYYLHVAVNWKVRKGVFVMMKKFQWLTNQWQDCSKPEHGGLGGSTVAVSCGQYIYLFTNTEMHRYDPSQDQWSKGTPPRTIPQFSTAVAIGTEIFCADLPFKNTVVYDVETDSWCELPGWLDQTIDKLCPILCTNGGQLHALVELNPYNDDDSGGGGQHAYVYDRLAGAWRDLQVSLPSWNHQDLCAHVYPVARMYTHLPDRDDDMDTRN